MRAGAGRPCLRVTPGAAAVSAHQRERHRWLSLLLRCPAAVMAVVQPSGWDLGSPGGERSRRRPNKRAFACQSGRASGVRGEGGRSLTSGRGPGAGAHARHLPSNPPTACCRRLCKRPIAASPPTGRAGVSLRCCGCWRGAGAVELDRCLCADNAHRPPPRSSHCGRCQWGSGNDARRTPRLQLAWPQTTVLCNRKAERAGTQCHLSVPAAVSVLRAPRRTLVLRSRHCASPPTRGKQQTPEPTSHSGTQQGLPHPLANGIWFVRSCSKDTSHTHAHTTRLWQFCTSDKVWPTSAHACVPGGQHPQSAPGQQAAPLHGTVRAKQCVNGSTPAWQCVSTSTTPPASPTGVQRSAWPHSSVPAQFRTVLQTGMRTRAGVQALRGQPLHDEWGARASPRKGREEAAIQRWQGRPRTMHCRWRSGWPKWPGHTNAPPHLAAATPFPQRHRSWQGE